MTHPKVDWCKIFSSHFSKKYHIPISEAEQRVELLLSIAEF